MISIVPRNKIVTVWVYVRDFLQAAIDFDPRVTLTELLSDIMAGTRLLWVEYDENSYVAACTTSILDLPKGRTCVIEWLGGKYMEDWFDHISTIENYAKDVNCAIIECHGRPGWKKALKEHGWDAYSVSYQKEL